MNPLNKTVQRSTVINAFSFWDSFLLTCIFIFTCSILGAKFYSSVDAYTFSTEIGLLGGGAAFCILMLQFKAIRKLPVFFAWMIISIILLAMFFWLHNDTSLLVKSKNTDDYFNGVNALKSPILILIAFQLLRQLSIRYFNKELFWTPRSTYWIKYMKQEGQHYTWFDKLSTIVLFGIFVLSILY